MRENSLAQTIDRRGQRPAGTQERPRGTAADGTTPPAVALLVAPALLAVCFR